MKKIIVYLIKLVAFIFVLFHILVRIYFEVAFVISPNFSRERFQFWTWTCLQNIREVKKLLVTFQAQDMFETPKLCKKKYVIQMQCKYYVPKYIELKYKWVQ